jgi:hypothetical protein
VPSLFGQRTQSRRFTAARSARVTSADQRIRASRCDSRAAAVRYASVGAGFRGPCGPRTEAERATDGAGGSGYSDRPAPLLASDLPFQEACSVSSSSSPGVWLGAADVECVGDALVRGGGLAVDAVGVDLEQDRDAVPANRLRHA